MKLGKIGFCIELWPTSKLDRLRCVAACTAILSYFTAVAGSPSGNRLTEIRLGIAVCRATDSTLEINSGSLKRIYRIGPYGLHTISIGDRLEVYHQLPTTENSWEADWSLGLAGNAVLKDLSARIDDDSGFTTKHITVTAEFNYPVSGIKLRYVLWVYPGSGIRSQLLLALSEEEKMSGKENDLRRRDTVVSGVEHQRVEYIPLPSAQLVSRVAFGYYNDTQHRDEDTMPILREEPVLQGASIDWASGLLVSKAGGGVIVVKESHKCVNQQGVFTGSFDLGPDGIRVTGAGLSGKDLVAGRYKTCWASWIIPFRGGSTDALLALKEFDRIRFPIRASDRYIMANTWGNSDTSPEGQGQYAAREENVLKEIASQASLGVDVQQIDDGWQGRDYKQWRPAKGATMLSTIKGVQGPPYAIYPYGWSKVKAYAAEKKVKLGLWAAWTIPEEDLRWNYDHGGFQYVKLDFSSLNTKEKLDEFMAKVRSFVLYTHNTVRINWDVTENTERVGYYYAREFGNVWLANRKPQVPASVIYKPHEVLRNVWQLAKYLNLNQFQVAIQNNDKVNRRLSNAYQYSNEYSTAIALMSSPMFFSLTQFYTAVDRKKIKNLLSVYKRDREGIFKGYVFPVGDMPDDSAWTGLQDIIPRSATGWLLIFRELKNEHPIQAVRLEYIRDRSLEVTDLLTGKTKEVFVDKKGFANFRIDKPADYRFYRYRIKQRQ